MFSKSTPLLVGFAMAAASCFAQLASPTTASLQIENLTSTTIAAPAVMNPITTPTAVATTTTVIQAPPAPGYGAPSWLVEAARADHYSEQGGRPMQTQPLSSAVQSQSAHMTKPHAFQPTGSLSGKVVYAMAGHGWTYDSERQVYYTQRGMSNNIVEDFGNLDQMHIFAHLCWNSGATVVPLRPVDHQPEERIVDNTSPQAQFFGNWNESTSKVFYGTLRDKVPYAYAPASRTETAVARFRPWIPVTGEYPVYAWARDGVDRVAGQLYRVVTSGGVTDIHVNHRRVGKGWVWLGTFYFEKGDTGYVEVSNQVTDPYEADGHHVVVADAIRFGNGTGDIPRPAGRSGYVREDEGDCYWIQRSLGPTADNRLFTSVLSDGNATIASPPRTAAYMNRESEGRYTDSVLISFHSNAFQGKSRGCVGLFNQSPEQRPDYQELLAQFIGTQVNQEMREDPPFAWPKWADRDRVTYNGINFGELRKDYIQNEMCATIIEVAFHDNPEDAQFLLDPRARMDMGRATLRGLLKWFAALRAPNSVIAVLPTAPENPVAQAQADGRIRVSWQPGRAGRIEGDPATDYRVYFSKDGFCFDCGKTTQGELTATVDPVTSSGPTFIRVTGLNAGGESWPSQVIAAISPSAALSVTTAPATIQRALLVAGLTSLDATANEPQILENDLGNPPDNGQTTYRVRPRTVLNGPRMRAAAEALTSCGVSFDSCNARSIAEGRVRLTDYPLLIWSVGRQNPRDGILTTATQAMLADYLRRGGKLFLNGAHLAEALDGPSPKVAPLPEDRAFLQQMLGVAYRNSNLEARTVAAVPGGALAGLSDIMLTGNEQGASDALPSDVVAAVGHTGEVLRYKVAGAAAAAVAGGSVNGKTGSWMFFAFPFENIEGEAARAQVMRAVLEYLQ